MKKKSKKEKPVELRTGSIFGIPVVYERDKKREKALSAFFKKNAKKIK